MLKAIHYELKYRAEKEKVKKQFYKDIVSKVELMEQIEDKNKTISHLKEVIKSLRKQIKNNEEQER